MLLIRIPPNIPQIYQTAWPLRRANSSQRENHGCSAVNPNELSFNQSSKEITWRAATLCGSQIRWIYLTYPTSLPPRKADIHKPNFSCDKTAATAGSTLISVTAAIIYKLAVSPFFLFGLLLPRFLRAVCSSCFQLLSQLKGHWLVSQLQRPAENVYDSRSSRWMRRISDLKSQRSSCIARFAKWAETSGSPPAGGLQYRSQTPPPVNNK